MTIFTFQYHERRCLRKIFFFFCSLVGRPNPLYCICTSLEIIMGKTAFTAVLKPVRSCVFSQIKDF